MQEPIDFERVKKALAQMTRTDLARRAVLEGAFSILPRLVGACGPFSQTKRMALFIGRELLRGDCHIIAPCCPDYSHNGSQYTFRGMGGGISLLTQRHIAFLDALTPILNNPQVVLLYADHEVDNADIVRVTGKTKSEFSELVANSIATTRNQVASRGWKVERMTSTIPNLVDEEERVVAWISAASELQRRIDSETLARSDMYYRIRQNFTWEEMRFRTIRTAAQYVALGQFATNNGYLVCNHTTVNLSWYLQAETGVLHNPVSVY